MSLFAELQRRNVFRVAVAYIVAGWLLAQVLELVIGTFGAPDWVMKTIVALLVVGIVPVLIFSWVFEMTPEGIRRESSIPREESITAHTARKLDIAVIVLLFPVMGMLAHDRLSDRDRVVAPGNGQLPSSGGVGSTAPGAEPSADSRIRPAGDRAAIAVLPFENMSVDAANEFFADGIAEEILNLLAGVSDLEVASRTSSFAFKGKDTSLPEIANQLNVRYVLEGSVRKAGEQVRITAQLIDAQTDRHLWSETFDRTLDDIFAVQDEIAGAIGEALEVRLFRDSGETVSSESLDPEIYEAFLEARFVMRRRSPDAIARAIELLERVTAEAPDFARGLVLLAEAYILKDYDADADLQAAEAMARRALSLDPDLANAYMVLGAFARRNDDRLTEYRYYQRSIEFDPAEPRPHHWLAQALTWAGYLDRALAEIDEAIRLEPGNANAHGWRSNIRAAMGDLDGAVDDARKQVEFGNVRVGYIQGGIYRMMAGDFDSARQRFEGAHSGDDALVQGFNLLVDIVQGADEKRRELRSLLNQLQLDYYRNMLDQAMLVSGVDVDFLLDDPESVDSFSIVWHPVAAAVRADPRFVQRLDESGVIELWEELGPPPDCRKDGDHWRCGLNDEERTP